MAIEPTDNETKRQRVLGALVAGSSRRWGHDHGEGRERHRLEYAVTNPQIRDLNGWRVLTVDCVVTRDGVPLFEDRVNMPDPAVVVIEGGERRDDPLQGLRATLRDAVFSATKRHQSPRLERNPDGSFRGDTLAVRSGTADGYVQESAATWGATQNGPADTVVTTGNIIIRATNISGITFRIGQGFLGFDTSSLGAGADVSAAVLTLYADAAGVDNADSTTLEWYSYDWGGTLETADYRDCSPSTNITNLSKIAHIALSAWTDTANAANNLTADSGAVSSVNKTGTTYMVGLLDRAYGSAPSDANTVQFRSADEADTTYDPLLTVTYSLAGAMPPKDHHYRQMRAA